MPAQDILRQEIPRRGTIRPCRQIVDLRRPPKIIIKRVLAAARVYTRTFRGNNRPQPFPTRGTSAPQPPHMYQARWLMQERSIPYQFLRLR